jgi:hypothetical protein
MPKRRGGVPPIFLRRCSLRIEIAGRYTLDNVEEALHALESRRMVGKPLLVIAD